MSAEQVEALSYTIVEVMRSLGAYTVQSKKFLQREAEELGIDKMVLEKAIRILIERGDMTVGLADWHLSGRNGESREGFCLTESGRKKLAKIYDQSIGDRKR